MLCKENVGNGIVKSDVVYNNCWGELKTVNWALL